MTEFTVVPLELRRAAGSDKHELEGVCVPYGRTSMKTEHVQGERFLPGAFASLTSGAPKVRLRDAHVQLGEERRPVGIATEFRDTPDGLVGRFRFYDTPEGRGAWENVVEETYGGLSVGFMPVQDRKGADGAREILKAKLHHVALVDEPAYEEARVLAVRQSRRPLPDVSELVAKSYDVAALPDRPDLTSVLL